MLTFIIFMIQHILYTPFFHLFFYFHLSASIYYSFHSLFLKLMTYLLHLLSSLNNLFLNSSFCHQLMYFSPFLQSVEIPDQIQTCICTKSNEHEKLAMNMKHRLLDSQTFNQLIWHWMNPKCQLIQHSLCQHKLISKVLNRYKKMFLDNEDIQTKIKQIEDKFIRLKTSNAKPLKCCKQINKIFPTFHALNNKNYLNHTTLKNILNFIRQNDDYVTVIIHRFNLPLENQGSQILLKDILLLLNSGNGCIMLEYDKKPNSVFIPSITECKERFKALFKDKIINCYNKISSFHDYLTFQDKLRQGYCLIKLKVPNWERGIYLTKQKPNQQKQGVWIEFVNGLGQRRRVNPNQLYSYIQKSGKNTKEVVKKTASDFVSPSVNVLSTALLDIFSTKGLFFYFVTGNHNPLDFQEQIRNILSLNQRTAIFYCLQMFYHIQHTCHQANRCLLVTNVIINMNRQKRIHLEKDKYVNSIDFCVLRATRKISFTFDKSNQNRNSIVEAIWDFQSLVSQKIDYLWNQLQENHQTIRIRLEFNSIYHSFMILFYYLAGKAFQANYSNYNFC